MKLLMNIAVTVLVFAFSSLIPPVHSVDVKVKKMSVLKLLTNAKLATSQDNPTSSNDKYQESSRPSEVNQLSEQGQPSQSNQPSESQQFENRQLSDSSQSLQSPDTTDDRTRHILTKRWGRQMFGCHCSGFHIHCRSDSYCSARYGHGYKCRKSCCAMACGH